MTPRISAAAILAACFLAVATLLLTACRTRQPRRPPPAPVKVDRARLYLSQQARATDAATQTLYHQGDVIRSTITEAELAELRAQQARAKVILYLENTY